MRSVVSIKMLWNANVACGVCRYGLWKNDGRIKARSVHGLASINVDIWVLTPDNSSFLGIQLG